jgi:hypothetical protein
MLCTSSRNLPPIVPPVPTTFPTCALSITVVCGVGGFYSAYTLNHLLPKASTYGYAAPLRIGPDRSKGTQLQYEELDSRFCIPGTCI